MAEPIIVEAIRAPIAKQRGAFRDSRPDVVYASLLDQLLLRTGLSGDHIDDVITGCVTQYGEQGANISRLAILASGLPESVPGMSVNRLCGSSQQAIHLGAQAIAAGDARYVICGGVESMTRVPMFADLGGSLAPLNPDLAPRYEIIHQGESAERIAAHYQLSRAELDDFSISSHMRAAHAMREERFASQMIHLPGVAADGQAIQVRHDEGVRWPVDRAKIGLLPPAFRPDGVITAANSSQIADGAAVLLLADREAALADGLRPRARFRARVVSAGDPTMQLLEIIPATAKALARAHLSLEDIDLIEINEAFASVVLAWAREVQPAMERVNPNGGAIAHGHPLGATGAILMTKLLHELERIDGQFGLQVMCIGHGLATATIIERLA